MEADEYFDVLDWQSGEKTGEVISRQLAHQSGAAHEAIHIWIFTKHRGEYALLLQQRAWDKPNFPGMLDATVGGHFRAGEGIEEVLRETKEELGITVRSQDLQFVDRHPFELKLSGYLDREWIGEYFMFEQQELQDYSFPDQEAIGLAAIPFAAMERLIGDPEEKVEVSFYDGGGLVEERMIERQDISAHYFEGNFFGGLIHIFKGTPDYTP